MKKKLYVIVLLLLFSFCFASSYINTYARNTESISDYDDEDYENEEGDDEEDNDSDNDNEGSNSTNILKTIKIINDAMKSQKAQKAQTKLGNAVINNIIFPEKNVGFFENVYNRIKPIILAFTLSLIVLYTLFYIFKVYVLWRDGNPEESPFELIFRYLGSMAIILCYEELYNIFGNIVISLMTKIEAAVFDASLTQISPMLPVYDGILGFLLGFVVLFIYWFQYLKALFNTLKIGIELLLLRLGFPLACLSFVTPQGNTFNSYTLVFIKEFLTATISVLLMAVATRLHTASSSIVVGTGAGHMWALACLFLINGTKELLNQFLIPTGGGGFSGTLVSQTMQTTFSAVTNAASMAIFKKP